MDEECSERINMAWSQLVTNETSMMRAQKKLDICQRELTRWSSKKIERPEVKLQAKTTLLAELQKHENSNNLGEIKKAQEEIDILLEQEDRWWKQRVKKHWYTHGDQNTKFFHA